MYILQKILSLFSRLSGHNIGLIDWEPHIPHVSSNYSITNLCIPYTTVDFL